MNKSLALDHLTALLDEDKKYIWTLEDAVEICRLLEPIAPEFGAHVALTGGCLYKNGKRKDADILFYRIRQVKMIDELGLIAKLRELGFEIIKRSGWVVKAKYEDKPLDLFFPEELKMSITGKCIDDQYPPGAECPACGKERVCIKEFDCDVWKHSYFNKCVKTFQASAEGLDFVLKINPATGDKYCPECEKQLYYNPVNDMWDHTPISAIPDKWIGHNINPNFVEQNAHGINHNGLTATQHNEMMKKYEIKQQQLKAILDYDRYGIPHEN